LKRAARHLAARFVFHRLKRDKNYLMKSAHLAGASLPQGMIGTVDVEFSGLPSISLSE
jgi:hypothetical protein